MFTTQMRNGQRGMDGRVRTFWSDVGTDLDLLSALQRGLKANLKYNTDVQIIVGPTYVEHKTKVAARIYK